ncbi:MAG: hypothetical protein HYW28_03870 [Rhodospirillales bacterium]|nr:hypothetical protein [Rhodospirillales bacterium]
MNSHMIAAVIGALFLIAFLLYFVIYIKSVPLSFIMIAIIVMVCANIYEEYKQQTGNDKS